MRKKNYKKNLNKSKLKIKVSKNSKILRKYYWVKQELILHQTTKVILKIYCKPSKKEKKESVARKKGICSGNTLSEKIKYLSFWLFKIRMSRFLIRKSKIKINWHFLLKLMMFCYTLLYVMKTLGIFLILLQKNLNINFSWKKSDNLSLYIWETTGKNFSIILSKTKISMSQFYIQTHSTPTWTDFLK